MRESKPSRIKRVGFSKESGYSELVQVVKGEKEKGAKTSPNIKLLKSVETAKEKLKIDPYSGTVIRKKLWPPKLVDKYEFTNLWKLNLYGNWRMLYTVQGDNVEIVSFILEILDHKNYDRLFGYSGKKRGS